MAASVWWRGLLAAAALVGLVACGDDEELPALRMSFETSLGPTGDVYAAPLPSDHRVLPDGTVEINAFPNPDGQPIVSKMLALLDGRADGFGTTSAIFFTSETALDAASLPSVESSITDAASVYLVAVDASSPGYLVRHPVDVKVVPEGGPYGASNMLVLLPLQGMPLLPATRYAAVVTNRVSRTDGGSLGVASALTELAAGGVPAGLQEPGLASYQHAVATLRDEGLLDEAVALTVFTTADPTEGMLALSKHAHSLPAPAPLTPLVAAEVFDNFCVFHAEVDMPVYQTGEPPYSEEGGEIPFAGGLRVDHVERSRLVVTIPRAPMPADGWPTAVMIRTGGGGDRPLVDRGVRDATGQPIEAGSGPARDFARVGFAGVTIDGPHGGIRNISNGDEQFLIFNFTNPYAMRDNIRQSAVELSLLPEMLDALSVDTSSCPDASGASTFDTSRLALMGHSMGATILPLVIAATPRFGAVILSGAGGSWIENVVFKRSPIAVRPFAEILVGYTGTEFMLHEHDPVLSLLQWAGEPADPPVYGRLLAGVDGSTGPDGAAPAHVLMLQGIVDTYILPPIANATSLSLGLDLAGPELDRGNADLAQFVPLVDVLPYVGRGTAAFPVHGNRHSSGAPGFTRAVVQHTQDAVEDGHEIAFQKEGPKTQYRCFLKSWLAGVPEIVSPDGSCD